ncbi:3-oxoacyl-[acyl-carrier-protein] synthase 3 [Serratia marcescens]|uniref:3-oxoacyl-[acyl-carrier-protein] synthase 3 n=1 Tax=Serratia marcescens TaxID=615 RepID=A0A380A4A7_SERMA|nr:3-oxoacyl-[acyl-carrier-protein] synthase 3 [Serratia marcescens]
MYTKILGTGSYLPVQVRTNADLEKMVDTSDEWIVTRTGIRERRIAAADETVATMSFQAAENALEMAGVAKEDIGLIIVATTTTTHAFPSAACLVQQMLGIKDCAAFDLAAACAGFTYALSVADQYVKNGAVKHALVIGADVLSRTLDPEDRGTIILFGDGAGAVVLGASEEPGILSTHLHADGSYGNLLTLPYKDRQNQDKPAYVHHGGQRSLQGCGHRTGAHRRRDVAGQQHGPQRAGLAGAAPGQPAHHQRNGEKTGHGDGQSGGDARIVTATPLPPRCLPHWTKPCATGEFSVVNWCCWKPSAAALPGARRWFVSDLDRKKK